MAKPLAPQRDVLGHVADHEADEPEARYLTDVGELVVEQAFDFLPSPTHEISREIHAPPERDRDDVPRKKRPQPPRISEDDPRTKRLQLLLEREREVDGRLFVGHGVILRVDGCLVPG